MICNFLVAYLIRHGLAGAVAGWLTAAALLASDVGGIRTLVLASDLFPVPLIMLLASFGLTFASVAMGAAIMSLGRVAPRGSAADRSGGSQGRQSAPVTTPAPYPPAAHRQ